MILLSSKMATGSVATKTEDPADHRGKKVSEKGRENGAWQEEGNPEEWPFWADVEKPGARDCDWALAGPE